MTHETLMKAKNLSDKIWKLKGNLNQCKEMIERNKKDIELKFESGEGRAYLFFRVDGDVVLDILRMAQADMEKKLTLLEDEFKKL